MGSLAEQPSIKVSCTLWQLVENAKLDLRRRNLASPQTQPLSLEQSERRIQRSPRTSFASA